MIEEIAKINIAGAKDYFDKVMDALHSLGIAEIKKNDEETTDSALKNYETIYNEELNKLDYKIAQTNFAMKFIIEKKNIFRQEKNISPACANLRQPATVCDSGKTGNKKVKTSLIDKLITPKIKITYSQLRELLKNYDWEKTITQCEKIEAETNNGLNKINSLKEKEKELLKWGNIKITTADLEETLTTKSILCELSAVSENKISELSDNYKLSASRIIKKDHKSALIILTFNKEIEKTFIEYINKNNIKIIELPELKNSPAQEIEKTRKEILNQEEELEKIKKNLKELVKEEKNLKILSDFLNWQKIKLDNFKKIFKSEYIFCITAWTAKKNVEIIKNKLLEICPDIIIDSAKIEEKAAEIPVILKNKNIAGPFEMVTDMYGSPLYNEPDPTPFLAPFFILFFALAITDAIYGIILAITAWLMIKILKLPKENQKLFKIIFYGGIATFLVGALFGGWGGAVLEKLPAAIGKPLMVIRLIDPITEPIKFLLFTFSLGMIQIISGLAISMWWKMKQGKIWDGIFDNGSWILLLGSLSLWAAAAQTSAGNYFKIASIASAVFLVFALGRGASNIIFQILKGLYGLYGITAFFSDMLSYSRLLALGLATGIIGMVINIIAGMSINMIPYAGWIIAIIILILGHSFNIAINVLGAYIHSSRLQYVEFFPKFMEGGGKSFIPFKRESKYVQIVNHEL